MKSVRLLAVLLAAVLCRACQAADPPATVPAAPATSPAKKALEETVARLREAAMANDRETLRRITADWVLPDAEARFKAAWGEALGPQLAKGYDLWTKQYCGVINSPLVENLRVKMFMVRVVELVADRPPRPGLEEQLVKGFGQNSPVLCFYLCNDNYGWELTWFPNIYFIRDGETFRCLGGARYLDFAAGGEAATAPADPIENQTPTLESFTRMIDAVDSTCKRMDWKQVKHATSKWRIPEEEKFFKSHWGEELGAKLAKEYASCAYKYTNFQRSEMGDRFWQGLEPKLEVVPADGKNLSKFLLGYVEATEGKSPIFIVKLMDPNSGRQAWGNIPFLFLDGAFRMIGMPEYMPSMRPR